MINTTELADHIEGRHDMVMIDEQRALIVAALRQYAALEWLCGLQVADRIEIRRRSYKNYLACAMGSVPRVGSEFAQGFTVIEAINNLRAKLEPPHEHV